VSVHPGGAIATEVEVPVGDAVLRGDLVLPEDPVGLVLFAHGTGSSRHSPRNRRVAGTLNEARIGTLLVDLLTPDEEEAERLTAEHRFDIQLLARRLIATIDWLDHTRAGALRVGLFGASTGAAAALVAATERPDEVAAIVSRGGRPDLAGPALALVRAPTLLIVGGADEFVLELNRRALELLQTEKQLVIIPGATHLFEEPGALEQVARLAADWFLRYLGGDDGAR
jgi:putative phosphoribosyl transferase